MLFDLDGTLVDSVYEHVLAWSRVFALHLPQSAVFRRFFRTPAKQLGAVPETPSSEMIELDFCHQLRIERLPFGGAFRAPAVGTTGGFPGEAGRLDYLLELPSQCRVIFRRNRRGESDVIELAFVVVEAK